MLSEDNVLLRLACVKHAASVCPEPGSNSPLYYYYRSIDHFIYYVLCRTNYDVDYIYLVNIFPTISKNISQIDKETPKRVICHLNIAYQFNYKNKLIPNFFINKNIFFN